MRTWTKDFYARQYELLNSPTAWARYFPADPPTHRIQPAAAVERLTGPGAKRVLELGCGGGLTAGVMAQLGHRVVAVDLVESAVISARRVASQVSNGSMRVVQGDFYELDLDGPFDVVCYFDGFGIGSDADQRLLLRRIAGWLAPEGCALIDIYSPWYHAHEPCEVYQEGHLMYRSDFDVVGSRLLESLWPVGEDEAQAVTQSLRCYSPADLQLLVEGTGLALDKIESYEAEDHEKQVPLKQAMLYLAKLIPDS